MLTRNSVIIILGPTCVGKTGASILLAKELDTEIISADSMQIYRHMDTGTAKPTPEQRAMVRHHMIDIAGPSETFSAGQYAEAVRPIIEGILAKGRIPVVVGGTGLYIRALTRGIFSSPSADWALRDKLHAIEKQKSGSLYDLLLKLDHAAASGIEPADTRRLIRALEVCLKTGKGISGLRAELTMPLPYNFIRVGLTRNRKELYRLIEDRVDRMFINGLTDEVRNLLRMNPGKTAEQAIGYKEVSSYLRGELPLEDAVSLIKKRTRNYAKRQFTWFRKEPDIRWIDVSGIYSSQEIFTAIALLLKIH
ncbi:MAG: tRNA (adenosine(37)-N6)-dimethylallyltransferase MiaA [Nitrospirota bacterium]|jgi:tRNA dimethylallyltransferase